MCHFSSCASNVGNIVSSSGSNKEVAVLQGHRRKRDLFEGLAGDFARGYYGLFTAT
jgi:hypothetical protein